MIAKGTPHRDGAILARYLVTGKDHERAELWELRGFPCTGIVPAFRSIHVMAAATKCLAPFFHVSVRNADGDDLDRTQWEFVANSVERMLGLTDQPRAIAFHISAESGHAHMHIAWSRINEETLTAKPLPFFKQRLKQVCRELEERFSLTPVPNERRSAIHFAPTRTEEEQARRLNIDVHSVRESIGNCFRQSDCGRSFREALSREGLFLARGDRRDFIVVDGAGGIHALGKRILGVSAAEIRHRLVDLCTDSLPTLEQTREFIGATNHPSAYSTLEDVCRRDQNAPRPVSSQRRPRDSVSEKKDRAGGKERLRDRGQTELMPSHSAFPVDQLATDIPAPANSLEIMSALTALLVTPLFAPCGNEPSQSQLLSAIAGPAERDSGPNTDRGNVEPLPATPAFAPKMPGIGARLREQFRVLAKQLTATDPVPYPTSRRRRRDDIGGGFRMAGLGLLRSFGRVPPLRFLDPTWEPFTWLRIWEYNSTARTDFHQDCSSPPPPEDLSLRL